MTAVEQEFTYPEAARILRVSEDWLRRNTPGRFPHRQIGRRVLFSAEHLAEIRALHEVRPGDPGTRVGSVPRPSRRRAARGGDAA